MGTSENAKECLQYILNNYQKPLVLDADAINLLAANRHLMALLRENILITPHLKEFERMVGPCKDYLERMEKAQSFCKTHGCVLILKGANSLISLPNGNQYFNSTGTQYMATGGAGDVLTGMLTSFLGQGYTAENAAVCGVFHHGLAGELASRDRLRCTIASDIVEGIPSSFVKLGIS
jgi:NAD(P)H-hydrate epimerase